MAKNIRIELPNSLSDVRKNYVKEALKIQNIESNIEGNILRFELPDEYTDDLICWIGMLIGVHMSKIF